MTASTSTTKPYSNPESPDTRSEKPSRACSASVLACAISCPATIMIDSDSASIRMVKAANCCETACWRLNDGIMPFSPCAHRMSLSYR